MTWAIKDERDGPRLHPYEDRRLWSTWNMYDRMHAWGDLR